MKIIRQIGIIFTVCWLSLVIEKLLPFTFPASVIGMILLFLCLFTGVVQLVFVCIISTIITFAVTAWSVKLTLRLMKSRKPENLQSGGGEK